MIFLRRSINLPPIDYLFLVIGAIDSDASDFFLIFSRKSGPYYSFSISLLESKSAS